MKKNYALILLCFFSIILSQPVSAGLMHINYANTFNPTRIFYFDVTPQDGKDLLKWEASVNATLAQFQIESSTDDIHFYAIDSVYQKAVNTDAASYEFYSPYVISGTRFYRLRLVYTDGYTEYTPVVTVDDNINNRVIVVNNSSKEFQLQTPYLLHTINVVNGSGQVLLRYSDVPAGKQTIDMSKFGAGIYWIQCISNKNEVLKILNG